MAIEKLWVLANFTQVSKSQHHKLVFLEFRARKRQGWTRKLKFCKLIFERQVKDKSLENSNNHHHHHTVIMITIIIIIIIINNDNYNNNNNNNNNNKTTIKITSNSNNKALVTEGYTLQLKLKYPWPSPKVQTYPSFSQ